MTCKKPCPQCPFARSTTKAYLDTKGDTAEKFIGQAAGPFSLPCHMQGQFENWHRDPMALRPCAGAAIYRTNAGYAERMPAQLATLPADHEAVFSNAAELLAHFRGITLEAAQAYLEGKPVDVMLRTELEQAHLFVRRRQG